MIDIIPTDASNIAQTSTAIVVAIIGAVFTLQKLMKGWKETATESNVIEIVNKQLNLMAHSNQLLTEEVSKLQSEIIALNRELRQLSAENQRLHTEVSSLTSEVNRLQQMLKQTD